MKGKIIAFEGTDASGKATQARLLAKRIRRQGKKVALTHFPRYNSFFGKLVKKYLLGEFGPKEALKPELCAMLFSLDKYDAADGINALLEKNDFLILDRYIASNAAHQGAKFSSRKRQNAFVKWVLGLEGKLPQPALTIFLDMPVEFSLRLMESRARAKDVHEADAAYLKRTRGIFLRLAKQRKWLAIRCIEGSRIRPIGEIHKEVWEKYLKRFTHL